ncbi:hypothetical protein [Aquimarina sp. Aq107]|uniref:hypothetical protein n=1 Tax=Aquimarina sp. Aq107 TaxID=1191912 RepID=UPI000D55BF51|nr:hypothetical protein [Aquimarina sp. Aq107]
MRKILTYILLLTICFGCFEKKTEWKTERSAIIFFSSEPKNETFTLTFKKNENSLIYQYVSHIDTSKTIFIKKTLESNFILFGSEKFIKTDKKPFKNEKLNDLEFEFYNIENPITDGTGPILFNPTYGLLAINNVFGPTIIFLDEKNDTITQQIITKLNE